MPGIDVNKCDFAKYTPLHICAQRNLIDYVKVLIDVEGINIKPLTINNKTPLDLATSYRQVEMVKFLTNVEEQVKIESMIE